MTMEGSEKNARDSVRRFVRFMLGLERPTFLFHQTLTCAPPELDATAAKDRLNRLLGNRFIRGAVYSEERQGNGGVHYHVLLFYYEQHGLPFPAQKMRDELRAAIFAAWNRYNGGIADRRGNPLREHAFNFASIEYLAKEARYREARKPGEPNWWGKRKARYLPKRPVSPTKQEIAAAMEKLFPGKIPLPHGLRCSMRQLKSYKRDFLAHCISNPPEEWEQFKRQETKRADAVSDQELLDFWKAQAALWRERQGSLSPTAERNEARSAE